MLKLLLQNRSLFCLSEAKEREPEDEQLCIAVHTIICSIITPRHFKE